MWPGRGNQREGDELAMPMNGLASVKATSGKQPRGGQETGTSKVAENQRKKKNWQFWGRKGRERELEQEGRGP